MARQPGGLSGIDAVPAETVSGAYQPADDLLLLARKLEGASYDYIGSERKAGRGAPQELYSRVKDVRDFVAALQKFHKTAAYLAPLVLPPGLAQGVVEETRLPSLYQMN